MVLKVRSKGAWNWSLDDFFRGGHFTVHWLSWNRFSTKAIGQFIPPRVERVFDHSPSVAWTQKVCEAFTEIPTYTDEKNGIGQRIPVRDRIRDGGQRAVRVPKKVPLRG